MVRRGVVIIVRGERGSPCAGILVKMLRRSENWVYHGKTCPNMRLLQKDNDDIKRRGYLWPLHRDNWKDQRNSGQNKKRSVDYIVQQFKFFKNNMHVWFFFAFLGYGLTRTENDEPIELVNGLIVWLVGLDAWIETLAKFDGENEPVHDVNVNCTLTHMVACCYWPQPPWLEVWMPFWSTAWRRDRIHAR